jgi:hypothetical protein
VSIQCAEQEAYLHIIVCRQYCVLAPIVAAWTKLTLESLAALAGVHINVVGRLEKGSYNPNWRRCERNFERCVPMLRRLSCCGNVSIAETYRALVGMWPS